jgi:hypothetical protein
VVLVVGLHSVVVVEAAHPIPQQAALHPKSERQLMVHYSVKLKFDYHLQTKANEEVDKSKNEVKSESTQIQSFFLSFQLTLL